MANLILASKREVKSGAQMWHVYRSEDNVKSGEFYFSEALKALRYAFILRKRTGAVIPKAIYNKLMAEVKASQPQQEASAAPEQESQPTAEVVGEASPLARQYGEMKAKHPPMRFCCSALMSSIIQTNELSKPFQENTDIIVKKSNQFFDNFNLLSNATTCYF